MTSTHGPKPHPPEHDTEESEDDGPDPDLPDPETTCSDAVECILDCANNLPPVVEGETPDLTCFFDCEAGLTVEEALLLVELGACVFDSCTEQGLCEATPENPLAPLDPEGDCILCIALGISVEPTNGVCEEEFLACD